MAEYSTVEALAFEHSIHAGLREYARRLKRYAAIVLLVGAVLFLPFLATHLIIPSPQFLDYLGFYCLCLVMLVQASTFWKRLISRILPNGSSRLKSLAQTSAAMTVIASFFLLFLAPRMDDPLTMIMVFIFGVFLGQIFTQTNTASISDQADQALKDRWK